MSFLRKLLSDAHWEKLSKSKRSSKAVRVGLDTCFLTTANIFLALAIQFENPRWVYIVLTVFFFVLYISCVIYYAAFDDYIKEKANIRDNTIDELNKQITFLKKEMLSKETAIKGCEESFSSIQAAIDLSAKNLNILRHDLMDDGKASEAIWNFPQMCAVICKSTFDILVKLYGNEQGFEVSYISYKKNGNDGHVSHMLCYETRNNEMPSIHDKDIFLPNNVKKISKRYCFERLLHERTNAPLILLDEEEIKENFKFGNVEKRNSCKYKQYIAIPICCEAKKPIGLLQIATFQNNLIIGDKDTINQNLITLLRPLAYLSLLANKTQDCIDLLGGKQ